MKILSIGKAPILVYQEVQNSCDHCKKIGARRSRRFFWALLALFPAFLPLICSVIIAASCLVLILIVSTFILVLMSPYIMVMLYFLAKLLARSCRTCSIISLILLLAVHTAFFLFQWNTLFFMYNPLIWLLFAITAPFIFSFILLMSIFIKMCGYTIMGLIYNAEIAAPIAGFHLSCDQT